MAGQCEPCCCVATGFLSIPACFLCASMTGCRASSPGLVCGSADKNIEVYFCFTFCRFRHYPTSFSVLHPATANRMVWNWWPCEHIQMSTSIFIEANRYGQRTEGLTETESIYHMRVSCQTYGLETDWESGVTDGFELTSIKHSSLKCFYRELLSHSALCASADKLLGLGWSECARREGALEEGDRETQRLCPDLCRVSRPWPSSNTPQLPISPSFVKFKE